MRRLILSLIVMLASSFSVWADDWVCMNIQKIPEDLTASIYERKDTNGKTCALLRVQILDINAKFKGNIVGEVERQGNEYLVYVPVNTREITILPSKGEVVVVDLPEMDSKVTYLIEMSQGENSLEGKQLNYNAMSLQELTALANKGDCLAQRKLGEIFSQGLENQKVNYKKSFSWYSKAALQGDAFSMCELGKHYINGCGIEKDLNKAYEWVMKSAERKNANAQLIIGSMYYDGIGVERDLDEALEWFEKSAEQGNAFAQYMAGLCLFTGDIFVFDEDEALKYFKKAAMNGCREAQCILGVLYSTEDSDYFNPKQAFFWEKMAADQELPMAMYHLGTFYENAIGTVTDIKEAKNYYKKAADRGVEKAKVALERLK